MSYYQGDYYRGDYYRGDPGFFSFLGGIAKKALGFIPGVGPIAQSAAQRLLPSGAGAMVRRAGAAIVKHPVLSAAGAAGVVGAGAGVMGRMGKGKRVMAPGMRRHRRMRVTNPKALRRAIRRTHGFAKLAMRTIHLVHPKKPATFGGFKKRRKRA
jgi:hypothetical protein